ncbi:hypothetical protein Hypma_009380 [Hypsizygus marmoreus]|uniref:Uncharacterized protein n=1 Tax=Hypsizygus marmoreus TaxID=39966 RepID=A0A369JTW3_HYPMA|nr:hypothetical protein Hypma_009380 [Hypsizygus marmoreus]
MTVRKVRTIRHGAQRHNHMYNHVDTNSSSATGSMPRSTTTTPSTPPATRTTSSKNHCTTATPSTPPSTRGWAQKPPHHKRHALDVPPATTTTMRLETETWDHNHNLPHPTSSNDDWA